MAVVYQTVKMSTVFEVYVDEKYGVFIFRNGRYYRPAHSIEEAKATISLWYRL